MTVAAGVVGAGTVSERHLAASRRSPRGRLVAVCDRDERRAASAADRYGIAGYGDVGAMLAGETLDVVHVCTPVGTHLPVARAAIEAGVAVLVEKPATTTTEDLETLQDLARRHEVPASVVHQSQFGPAMRRARRLVAGGRVGTVRGTDMIYTGAPRPDESGRGEWVFDLDGGEFEETLPHPLYLGLAGGYPRGRDAVGASTSLTGEYDREFGYDAAQVQFVTDAGGLSTVKILSGGHPTRLLVLHGEAGTVTVDFFAQTVVVGDRSPSGPLGRALRYVEESVSGLLALAGVAGSVLRSRLRDDPALDKRVDPHLYQIDETYRAIAAGGEMPVALGEAWWTVALMEEIRAVAAGQQAPE